MRIGADACVTSMYQIVFVLSVQRIFLESGDQIGWKRLVLPSSVRRRGGSDPSCGTTYSSSSPLASEKYAIDFPSGDQIALLSSTPGVSDRFRHSPFDAGTVKTSPRATTTARFPDGETSIDVTRSPTVAQCGRE